MSPKLDENRQHWDELGENYQRAWATASRKRISRHETGFIGSYLPQDAKTALDLGCGTGRILELLDARLGPKARIDACDLAPRMLEIVESRSWAHPTRFVELDLAKQALPFGETGYDLITSIRVIKYNPNWPEIIAGVSRRLNPGGVFVFSIPNRYSLNIFGRYAIPHYRTSKGELKNLAARFGLKILKIRGFSRIPDLFYQLPGRLADWVLALGEGGLNLILGKRVFQREYFVVFQKPLESEPER